jgi:hypothetical protein
MTIAHHAKVNRSGGNMNADQSKSGDSATLGVGGPTSGEAGSTLTHETMAETGGSGGEALTKPRNEESDNTSRPPGQFDKNQGDALQNAVDTASGPEGANTAATNVGRGAQDTRSQQAGISPTGLGTPETGGNQSEEDLAPPRQP